MTQEEIVEGNKLIAIFMGLKIGDAWQVWNNHADYSNDAEFEYHSSWEWIMPAVEKIAEYGKWELQPGFARLSLYPELGIGNKKSRRDKIKFITSEMDWERADGEPAGWVFLIFFVVVQFIKWYTAQTTNQQP